MTTPPKIIPRPIVRVPYLHMNDWTARAKTGDCSQTCVAMMLRYRGFQVTVDDITRKSQADGGANVFEIVAMFRDYGVTALIDYTKPPETWPATPSIAATRNVYWPRYKRTGKAGLHAVVLLGWTSDYVCYHDPARGAFQYTDHATWQLAHTSVFPTGEAATVVLI